MSLFRRSRSDRTAETVEALRAVKRIAEALHANQPVPASAVNVVDRVLRAPLAAPLVRRGAAPQMVTSRVLL